MIINGEHIGWYNRQKLTNRKAIMISIQPKWVAKILNGEKTIEIRKTMPMYDLPCKVYIYCTSHNKYTESLYLADKNGTYDVDYYVPSEEDFILNSKVVAEFTLNKVTKHEKNFLDFEDGLFYNFTSEDVKNAGFVNSKMDDWEELNGLLDFDNFVDNYGNGKPLYAWHIEDLKIYDKPKDLSEFKVRKYLYKYTHDCWDTAPLKRPFQSWGYVEELK